MNIVRIHNQAHEAICLQAIRRRRRDELEAEIVAITKASEQFDRAAEALQRRDYDRFDQIMSKRAYAGAGE